MYFLFKNVEREILIALEEARSVRHNHERMKIHSRIYIRCISRYIGAHVRAG